MVRADGAATNAVPREAAAMTMLLLLLAFAAGLVAGLALRPVLDRRRRLSLAIAQVRSRQVNNLAQPVAGSELPPVPRDYYLATARERGSLAEGFGLRGGSVATADATQGELDLASLPMPRDYYERETPDDEGILSEGYGLRRREPPDAAA